MYKINCHHQMKPKAQIETKFFFENYKISNEFFEKDIFMRLPQVKKDFKVKNETEACEHKELICVRRSEKLSSYYILPSIFTNKKDNNKCKTIMNKFLKDEIYNKLPKRLEKRVIDIFDELKIRKIEIEKFRELIIDFVEDVDKNSKYDHRKTMLMLEDINKKETIPSELFNLFEKKYSKLKKTTKRTEEEKLIRSEKRKLNKIKKEKENKEKAKVEAENLKSHYFRDKKEAFIENSLTDFINENDEYYNLFNKKAKTIIKKYFKESLNIIITSEEILNDKEIFKNHFESFLFFDDEKKKFLMDNKYILPLLNCEHLQFEYDYIIKSLKKEALRGFENHNIAFNNLIRKKSKKLNNGINFHFKIKLNKKTHNESDFIFTFNFKEFNEFEDKIKEYKSRASVEIMLNLINNINEDELNYYYGY